MELPHFNFSLHFLDFIYNGFRYWWNKHLKVNFWQCSRFKNEFFPFNVKLGNFHNYVIFIIRDEFSLWWIPNILLNLTLNLPIAYRRLVDIFLTSTFNSNIALQLSMNLLYRSFFSINLIIVYPCEILNSLFFLACLIEEKVLLILEAVARWCL